MAADDTDHVLDLIDNTLSDWEVSEDAMRSAPDLDLPDCRHEDCVGLDECMWMRHVGGGMVVDGDRFIMWPGEPSERVEPRPLSEAEGWQDVGYLVNEGFEIIETAFAPPGTILLMGRGINRGFIESMYGESQQVDPWPESGDTTDTETEFEQNRRAVAEMFNVSVDLLPNQRVSVGPFPAPPRPSDLPGPLATFHMDRNGHMAMSREAAERAVRRIGERAAEARVNLYETAAAMARAVAPLIEAVRPYVTPTDDGEGDDTQEPPNAWQRALQARRDRSTGPPRNPHRHRGMR